LNNSINRFNYRVYRLNKLGGISDGTNDITHAGP
jgi:hypothetical protein